MYNNLINSEAELSSLSPRKYKMLLVIAEVYRPRANRAWCKERGIRLSGSPLGRKPKNFFPLSLTFSLIS